MAIVLRDLSHINCPDCTCCSQHTEVSGSASYEVDLSQAQSYAAPCRDYSLMFGGGALLVSFVPSFRNMRILSIIAILGTTYTSW